MKAYRYWNVSHFFMHNDIYSRFRVVLSYVVMTYAHSSIIC